MTSETRGQNEAPFTLYNYDLILSCKAVLEPFLSLNASSKYLITVLIPSLVDIRPIFKNLKYPHHHSLVN